MTKLTLKGIHPKRTHRQLALPVALLALFFFEFGCVPPDEDGGAADELGAQVEDVATASAELNGHSQCSIMKGSAHPNVITHLHDATLQQFVGRTRMRNKGGQHLSIGKKRGALLGTVTGANADGSLLANHHWSFDSGVLRTQDDIVALTPTADPCVFDLDAQFFFVDGSGPFTGLSGSGHGIGSFNGCSGEVDFNYQATLCP